MTDDEINEAGTVENIVYILGAGFSAPLGLPVMSNFLEKSKDQFAREPERFAYFQEVFDAIDRLHKAKSYYATNLFNIEDILSILEFQTQLGDPNAKITRDKFINYVVDVIKFHTPTEELISSGTLTGNHPWPDYVVFAMCLMYSPHVSRATTNENRVQLAPLTTPNYQRLKYSIVTLNYDMVFETIQRKLVMVGAEGRFHRYLNESEERYHVNLAKLHGSVDQDNIIPPTWNKSLPPAIHEDWNTAHKALREANQLRIIGYSLPETDTYFKFLLRSTVISSPNLRAIDVICLDQDGSTQKRYDTFVLHPSYRFRSARIGEFFPYLRRYNEIQQDIVETAHDNFMNYKDRSPAELLELIKTIPRLR